MSTGKRYRLAFWLKNGRTFSVVQDEVIPRGLDRAPRQLEEQLAWLTRGPADGLVLHTGIANRYAHLPAGGCPWIMKLTTNVALVDNPTTRGRIGSDEQALRLGASGVVVNVLWVQLTNASSWLFWGTALRTANIGGCPLSPPFSHPQKRLKPQGAGKCLPNRRRNRGGCRQDGLHRCTESFAVVIAHSLASVLAEDSQFPEMPESTLATAEGVITACGPGVLFGQRVWGSPDGPAWQRRSSGPSTPDTDDRPLLKLAPRRASGYLLCLPGLP